MTGSEQIVRRAYQVAEDMDMAAWSAAFTDDGTFTDMSIGVTWQGTAGHPPRPAVAAGRDAARDRQEDEHAVLPRIRARRRQDQALRLLPRRDHHPHPAGRAR